MKTHILKKQPLAIAVGIILAGAGAINQLNTDSFELIPAANAQSHGNGGQRKGSDGKGGVVLASDDGGHDSGGHTPGGSSSGGHSSGSHSSDSSHGKGAASSSGRGKGNPAAEQHGGGRASDPDAERGAGYHGGTSIESKVLRGGSSKGKGGPGGPSNVDKHTDGETDDHDDDSHSSGIKGRKPPNAGKPEGVGGEDDHDH